MSKQTVTNFEPQEVNLVKRSVKVGPNCFDVIPAKIALRILGFIPITSAKGNN